MLQPQVYRLNTDIRFAPLLVCRWVCISLFVCVIVRLFVYVCICSFVCLMACGCLCSFMSVRVSNSIYLSVCLSVIVCVYACFKKLVYLPGSPLIYICVSTSGCFCYCVRECKWTNVDKLLPLYRHISCEHEAPDITCSC